METTYPPLRAGSHTLGLAPGTLLWTADGLRPIQAVQPSTSLIGFDPHSLAQEVGFVQAVQRHHSTCWRVEAGGRLLLAAANQLFAIFDLEGAWTIRPAETLQPDLWMLVAHHVPSAPSTITLPPIDQEIVALVGEDALAMTDALHSPRDYFAEMGKRDLRLKLLELSGFLLGGATLIGDDVVLDEDDPEIVGYYRDILQRTFGAPTSSARALSRRLRRWMEDGLAPTAQRALPLWAVQLESQGRAAFLRGFFDATGVVATDRITVQSLSPSLLVGIQALLGTLAIEARIESDGSGWRLSIRNVRRFAEWVHSNVAHKAALLRMVYAREPRYPTDSTARLPLNLVRPALERIRALQPAARRPATAERVDEHEATTVETLRLLATAFHDEPLRELLNRQLFLEPVTRIEAVGTGEVFEITATGSQTLVANGIILPSAL